MGLEVSKSQARSGSSVFVGVDVFGRSSSSAGGFQTDLAMKKIQRLALARSILDQQLYSSFLTDKNC